MAGTNFDFGIPYVKPIEGETSSFDEALDFTGLDEQSFDSSLGTDLFLNSSATAGYDLQTALSLDDTMAGTSAWNAHDLDAFTAPGQGQLFGSYQPSYNNLKRSLQLDTQDFPQAKRMESTTTPAAFSPFPTTTSVTGSNSWTVSSQPTPPSMFEMVGLTDEAADLCSMWFTRYAKLPSDLDIESLSNLTGESSEAIRQWFGQMLKQGLAGHDSAYKSQTSLTNPSHRQNLQVQPHQQSFTTEGSTGAQSVLALPECPQERKSTQSAASSPLRGGKKGCSPTNDPELLRRDETKVYQCTRKCGKKYGRKCDWKRNEEESYPSKYWICSLCTDEGVQKVRPCFRRYHFSQHFQNLHSGHDVADYEEKSTVFSDTTFPRKCGFCPHRFVTRQDRIDHIADHFRLDGKCMLDWVDDDEDNNGSDDADDDDRPDSDDFQGPGSWNDHTGGSWGPPGAGPSGGSGFGGGQFDLGNFSQFQVPGYKPSGSRSACNNQELPCDEVGGIEHHDSTYDAQFIADKLSAANGLDRGSPSGLSFASSLDRRSPLSNDEFGDLPLQTGGQSQTIESTGGNGKTVAGNAVSGALDIMIDGILPLPPVPLIPDGPACPPPLPPTSPAPTTATTTATAKRSVLSYSHQFNNPRPCDEGNAKGKCPVAGCGRMFRDLKTHLLTHENERPEKCPITTCEYNMKGFARKYDKNRHTLTHYRSILVCGFCPDTSVEKSFNRVDVFKRHLTSTHGVEQTLLGGNTKKRRLEQSKNRLDSPSGVCSQCLVRFDTAQDLYEHLDGCLLQAIMPGLMTDGLQTRDGSSETQCSLQVVRSRDAVSRFLIAASNTVTDMHKGDNGASSISKLTTSRDDSAPVKGWREIGGLIDEHSSKSQSFLSVKLLGTGGFSTVDEVVHQTTNLRISRKTLKNRNPSALAELKKEVGVLQKLRHPHVIRFLGAYSKDDKVSIMLSPVAETTLSAWLRKCLDDRPTDLEATILKMYGCLSSSVRYLHEQRPIVKHMDIKPQNILVKIGTDGQPHVILSDFGVSSDEQMSDNARLKPLTRQYCAPEVPVGISREQAADIWSLGCVFLEMAMAAFSQFNSHWLKFREEFCGFEGKYYWQNVSSLQTWLSRFVNSATRDSETTMLSTVKDMLSEDPSQRPDAAKLTLIFTPASCCLSWANENVSFPGPLEELNTVGTLVQEDGADCLAQLQVCCNKEHEKDHDPFARARAWLENCSHDHEVCQRQSMDAKTLPTRLLEIQSDGTSVCVVDTQELPGTADDVDYVAISHMWNDKDLTLSSDLLQSVGRQLPTEKLSTAVKDAIVATNRIGHRYLWVDSLCVQQDSEQEKQQECAAMASVFRNAALTINVNEQNHVGCGSLNETGLTWDTRTWARQDRLLSHRLLYLAGEQLYWECNALKASETFPRGLSPLLWEKAHTKQRTSATTTSIENRRQATRDDPAVRRDQQFVREEEDHLRLAPQAGSEALSTGSAAIVSDEDIVVDNGLGCDLESGSVRNTLHVGGGFGSAEVLMESDVVVLEIERV
ncbi:hypothetical protein EJ04DRAFT_514522 [Polyplosphaeria fusca]|uniref:Protein kinase domain-containing protein n=1 Tax=Polyplosphaeria fusca TaxID=682080 RepID=A0A9P4UYN9_9PLEO|nr:hypothetical protein EJ04DRAFT_514522 [Polyplosphaeria fusca]